jgi:hypothetical protein
VTVPPGLWIVRELAAIRPHIAPNVIPLEELQRVTRDLHEPHRAAEIEDTWEACWIALLCGRISVLAAGPESLAAKTGLRLQQIWLVPEA